MDDTVSIKEHFEKIMALNDKLIAANDRRYTEVNIEKEKALSIKEEGDKEARRIKDEADKTALGLAREIQTYKDETHNGLLKQWQAERGTYVTADKFEGAMKPINDFMSTQRGKTQGVRDFRDWVPWIITIAMFLLFLYNNSKQSGSGSESTKNIQSGDKVEVKK